MPNMSSIVKLTILAILAGCTSYYYESNLNTLHQGITEQSFLSAYHAKHGLSEVPGASVRAAKVVGGDTLHVVTVPLSANGSDHEAEYWFLFKNGRLEQWGKPEDWQAVSARYEIAFTPGVRAP